MQAGNGMNKRAVVRKTWASRVNKVRVKWKVDVLLKGWVG